MAYGKQSLKKCIAICSLCLALLGQSQPAASFSIKDERELGEKLVYQVRRAFPLLEEPDLSQYINGLGNEILAVAGKQYFAFHFYIIKSRQFNAFAAPSGLIFFYSGLITKMESENELVAVMGHEVGHVVKRHIATGQKQGAYSNAAALAVAMLGIAIGGKAAPALVTGALATGQTVNLHYSRVHEQEADSLSYEWMRRMKRNPKGELNMLRTMRRIARYRSDKLPQYLLTHPNPEERMGVVESFLEHDGVPDGTRQIDEFNFFRFKARILVFSEKPERLRNAFASILSAKKLSPLRRAYAQFGLALLAREELDFDTALGLMDNVMSAFPKRTILMVDKGNILVEAGRPGEGLSLLERAHQMAPADLYAAWSLGRALKRTGHLEEARALLLEVEHEMPHWPKLLFELGQLEARRGNQGIANGWLAASQLNDGELKEARASLHRALSDKALPDEWKRRCVKMEETLRSLKK